MLRDRMQGVEPDFFTEQLGTYLIEVASQAVHALSRYSAVRFDEIGQVIAAPVLRVADGAQRITWDVDELRSAWQHTFDWE